MTPMLWIQIAAAVQLVFASFFTNTFGTSNMFLFRIIPLALGVGLAVNAYAALMGWV